MDASSYMNDYGSFPIYFRLRLLRPYLSTLASMNLAFSLHSGRCWVVPAREARISGMVASFTSRHRRLFVFCPMQDHLCKLCTKLCTLCMISTFKQPFLLQLALRSSSWVLSLVQERQLRSYRDYSTHFLACPNPIPILKLMAPSRI